MNEGKTRLGKFDKWGYTNMFSKKELARELVYTNEDNNNLRQEIERLNNGCKELEQQIDDLHKLETTLTNENERLNNIIKELEKELNKTIEEGRSEDHLWLMGYYDASKNYLNKLKELKEKKND